MFKMLMFTYICTKLKDADMYQNICNIKNYIGYIKKYLLYYLIDETKFYLNSIFAIIIIILTIIFSLFSYKYLIFM